MKTLVVIVLATLSVAVGEALLASGMKQVGDVSALPPGQLWRMSAMAFNPRVVLGTSFMAAFFFLFSAALSWSDLSYAQPLTALSFVFTVFIARYALNEDVSWWRWAGTAVIIAGVVLVTMDSRQLTVRAAEPAAAAQPEVP